MYYYYYFSFNWHFVTNAAFVSSYEIIGGSLNYHIVGLKYFFCPKFGRCEPQIKYLHEGIFRWVRFTRDDDEPPMWLVTPWYSILSIIWSVIACYYKMLLLHQFSCYIIFLCEFPIQLNSTFTIDVKLDSSHGSNAVAEGALESIEWLLQLWWGSFLWTTDHTWPYCQKVVG